MPSSETSEINDEIAIGCSEWTNTDLAVTGKLGVGVGCPWSPTYPTAYIHGTMQVKDRTDVGRLGFLINSVPPTYPLLSGDQGVASQLDLTGSLRLIGPPVGTPVEGPARLIVDGQADPSGSDAVPLQLWRSSNGTVLNVVTAKGSLGIGTPDPEVPLDVAGNTHVGGSLSIGAGTYSNSLTIQGTFSEQITGTFSGQANLETIDGDAGALRVGDLLQIVSDGKLVLTKQKLNIFQVKTVAGDLQSFTVVVPPDTDFSGASIFVDQPPLVINNSAGVPLLSINRYGDVHVAATLNVIGDAAVGGVLNGSGIVREAQIANAAVTLSKLAAGSVGTGQLVDRSVTTGKLADWAVGSAQIADKTVLQGKLADWAVGSGQIADKAVLQGKLADWAVGSGQIADKAVLQGKLADGAVGPGQIADNAVTASKIAGRSVTLDKLATYMISGIVDPNGGYTGTGFTVSRTGEGFYNVTFSPALTGVLGASATQIFPWPMSSSSIGGDTRDNAVIIYLGNDLMRVKTGDKDGIARDRSFTFVVITN